MTEVPSKGGFVTEVPPSLLLPVQLTQSRPFGSGGVHSLGAHPLNQVEIVQRRAISPSPATVPPHLLVIQKPSDSLQLVLKDEFHRLECTF